VKFEVHVSNRTFVLGTDIQFSLWSTRKLQTRKQYENFLLVTLFAKFWETDKKRHKSLSQNTYPAFIFWLHFFKTALHTWSWHMQAWIYHWDKKAQT